MENRNSDEATTEDKPRLPVVRARKSWHWTCTSCSRTQICKRSDTHTAECWGCGQKFTVDIRG